MANMIGSARRILFFYAPVSDVYLAPITVSRSKCSGCMRTYYCSKECHGRNTRKSAVVWDVDEVPVSGCVYTVAARLSSVLDVLQTDKFAWPNMGCSAYAEVTDSTNKVPFSIGRIPTAAVAQRGLFRRLLGGYMVTGY